MQELPNTVSEALQLLSNELRQAPCVARSSIIMGVLQERLFLHGREQGPLQVGSSSSGCCWGEAK